MKKLVSQKSQDSFKKLMWEAKRLIQDFGADARFSNTYYDDETRNLTNDMLRLAKGQPRRECQNLKSEIITQEEFDLRIKAVDLVVDYLNRRVENYNEKI